MDFQSCDPETQLGCARVLRRNEERDPVEGVGGKTCPGMKVSLGMKIPLALSNGAGAYHGRPLKWLGLGTGHHTTSCPMSRTNSVTYMPWQMGSHFMVQF